MNHRFTLAKDMPPQHYHAERLRAWVVLVGWPASLVLGVGGVVLVALSGAPAAEGLGMVLAAVGGVGIVGLVRCRRFEVVVTAKTLEVAAGPLRRRVPLAFITAVTAAPAASWRRLYADQEVRVELQAGGRPIVVPAGDPDELIAVLAPPPSG